MVGMSGRTPGMGLVSRYWWAMGMMGTVTPARRPISGANMPPALTTTSVRISPRSVTTPRTRPPGRAGGASGAALVPGDVHAGLRGQAPVQAGAVHHHPREGRRAAQLPHQAGRMEGGPGRAGGAGPQP